MNIFVDGNRSVYENNSQLRPETDADYDQSTNW